MCVHWDTRHSGGTYSSVPSTHSTEDSGVPIPEIIWRQIQKFCEGVHHRGAEHTKTWGLPFAILITHILRKVGIKGTSADGPITESPHFGSIQWRQSLSHMPRAAPQPALQPEPEPAPEPEPMDIPEMAAEPEIEAEQGQPEEYEEEYEEGIMIRRSDLLHFQDTLVDLRSQFKEVKDQLVDYSEGRSPG
jgi:hypothetical protein